MNTVLFFAARAEGPSLALPRGRDTLSLLSKTTLYLFNVPE